MAQYAFIRVCGSPVEFAGLPPDSTTLRLFPGTWIARFFGGARIFHGAGILGRTRILGRAGILCGTRVFRRTRISSGLGPGWKSERECEKKRGHIVVNDFLEVPGYPEVWAAGHCAPCDWSQNEAALPPYGL